MAHCGVDATSSAIRLVRQGFCSRAMGSIGVEFGKIISIANPIGSVPSCFKWLGSSDKQGSNGSRRFFQLTESYQQRFD